MGSISPVGVRLSSDDPSQLFPTEEPQYPSLRRAVRTAWQATTTAFGELRERWFEVAGLTEPERKPLPVSDKRALDAAINEFLRRFGGGDRTAQGFASQASEDGILQQSVYLAHAVGARRAIDLTGSEMDVTLTAAVRERLAGDAFRRLSEDGVLRFETRLDEIKQKMYDAFGRGDNPLTVARQLGRDLDGYEAGRLRTIVRTEMGIASEEAAKDIYRSEGVLWVEVLEDPGTDELCTSHLSTRYSIDDTENHPPFHPNCFGSCIPWEDR